MPATLLSTHSSTVLENITARRCLLHVSMRNRFRQRGTVNSLKAIVTLLVSLARGCLAVFALGFWAACACSAARAEVVCVVSANSPVAALSRDQVADIFLARSDHFPDGSPVLPIDQPEGSLMRKEFYATFAGMSGAQLKTYWARIIFTGRGQPPRIAENLGEIRKLLAQNPGAIAYMERDAVDTTMKILARP